MFLLLLSRVIFGLAVLVYVDILFFFLFVWFRIFFVFICFSIVTTTLSHRFVFIFVFFYVCFFFLLVLQAFWWKWMCAHRCFTYVILFIMNDGIIILLTFVHFFQTFTTILFKHVMLVFFVCCVLGDILFILLDDYCDSWLLCFLFCFVYKILFVLGDE